MKLKTITLVVLAVFALSAAVLAQGTPAQRPGGPGHRGGPGGPGMRIFQELGLSREQAQQIQTIVQKYNTDLRTLMQSNATRQEKATKSKALKDKASADIMALLTPEQKVKAQKMKLTELLLNPRAQQDARYMWALNQLNLTDEQKAKVKTVLEDSQAKMKALRDDQSLDQATRRAKMAEIRQSTMDGILAVLTPEQQAKFKELMARQQPPRGAHQGRQTNEPAPEPAPEPGK